MVRATIFVVLILLLVWFIAEASDSGINHDGSERIVATWGSERPPYVVDEQMFTTTTQPRARTAPSKRTTVHTTSVGAAATVRPSRWPTGCTTANSLNPGPCVPASRPCAIPAYICNRESHMTINVWNHGGSGASGKYQAMPSTWNNFGGYLYAAWAPEEVQDDWAARLWNSPNGPCHWSAC